MKPPFFGTKVLDPIPFDDVESSIDREALFASRWQMRQGAGIEKWGEIKKTSLIPEYEKLISRCRSQSILEPKAVYGYFECGRQGNGLIVTDGIKSFRFDFPRESMEPHRCLADFFPDGFIAIMLVTIGKEIANELARLFADNKYRDSFFLKGLAAEAAEGLAKFLHHYICDELGVPQVRGARFSPGFPSFPDLFDQRKIMALLGPKKIGVSLTDTCQMVPEYSVSAIISVDSKAMLFRP